ncbi:DgyrCDS5422 [Dimorphilus gyrociliatus]|uniref:Condensin complex subunit 2 n=1 Tax=Dimorphilus gyrociliatus TaxID=2664684 RepID=A0A7I8VKI5_9ANNE|nr:DgyrCDS5422 [Dimorphilus gyrociliatus]
MPVAKDNNSSNSIRRRSGLVTAFVADIAEEHPIKRKNVPLTPMMATSISSASKSVGGPASILTEECMRQFNNTVKFVSDNKLTKRNCFQLNMLTDVTMKKVWKKDDQADTFQKASSALGANTKIYAYRVDTVHHDTRRYIQDMQRNRRTSVDGAHEIEQDMGTEENQDEETTKKKDKRKTRKLRKKDSIAKNLDNITDSADNSGVKDTSFRLRRKYEYEPDTKRGMSHMLGRHEQDSLVPLFAEKDSLLCQNPSKMEDFTVNCRQLLNTTKNVKAILPDIRCFSFLSGMNVSHPEPEQARNRVDESVEDVNQGMSFNYSMPPTQLPAEDVRDSISADDGDDDHLSVVGESEASISSPRPSATESNTTISTLSDPSEFLQLWKKKRRPRSPQGEESKKPSVDVKKKRRVLFYDCELLPDTRRYSDLFQLKKRVNTSESDSRESVIVNKLQLLYDLLDVRAMVENNRRLIKKRRTSVAESFSSVNVETKAQETLFGGENIGLDDANDDDDAGGDAEPNMFEGEGFDETVAVQSFAAVRSLAGELVTPPTKLARLELQYEKKARDVNIEKLKAKITSYLKYPAPLPMADFDEKGEGPDKKESDQETQNFSGLYQYLCDRDDKVRDGYTSLPYVFSALLQLSNKEEINFAELNDGDELILTYTEKNE